ncbi:MAG: DoxX family protein [Chloroflexota bacterium]|nr:DoxX family protein [Chloroflexota bacterium]
MKDIGLLVLRATTGGLIAGHGSQKLLGAFGGPGLEGTAGFMESLGLRPGKYWGTAAALSETSGILTALGLLHPLGPLGTTAAMTMATAKAHWGKPIWATAGGAELAVTNIAASLALMLTGPGKYSLDQMFGIKLPRPLVIAAILAAAGAVAYGIVVPPADQQDAQAAAE